MRSMSEPPALPWRSQHPVFRGAKITVDKMIITIVLLILALALWYFFDRKDHTVLTFVPTESNRAILDQCKTVKLYDNIPIWGFNGHVQSYFASQIRKGPTYPFRRCAFLVFLDLHFLRSTYFPVLQSTCCPLFIASRSQIVAQRRSLVLFLSATELSTQRVCPRIVFLTARIANRFPSPY